MIKRKGKVDKQGYLHSIIKDFKKLLQHSMTTASSKVRIISLIGPLSILIR